MLKLKAVLAQLGKTQTQLGQALGFSKAAIAQIVNHNHWPKQPEQALLKQQIEQFLKECGATAATVNTAFDEEGAMPCNPKSQEDDTMLLRKQPLYPTTRKHFGIFNDPFADIWNAEQVFNTPDVHYVRGALAQVINSECFIAVVGESGAGKSTLRRDLLDRIGRDSLPVIVIEPYVLGLEDNDKKGKCLKASDLAAAIIRTVDPQERIRQSAEARYAQLHRVLRDSRRSGNRHVLIIEEAHSISIPTLKHLKRFFELEDGFNRLLSIVLIGQPELAQKLAENKAEVREVVQRIELITLAPLDNQLEAYLKHRFGMVGKSLADVMDASAIDALRAKLTVPARDRSSQSISLLYPLAVGNQVTAALNMAASIGAPKVTADVIKAV